MESLTSICYPSLHTSPHDGDGTIDIITNPGYNTNPGSSTELRNEISDLESRLAEDEEETGTEQGTLATMTSLTPLL